MKATVPSIKSKSKKTVSGKIHTNDTSKVEFSESAILINSTIPKILKSQKLIELKNVEENKLDLISQLQTLHGFLLGMTSDLPPKSFFGYIEPKNILLIFDHTNDPRLLDSIVAIDRDGLIIKKILKGTQSDSSSRVEKIDLTLKCKSLSTEFFMTLISDALKSEYLNLLKLETLSLIFERLIEGNFYEKLLEFVEVCQEIEKVISEISEEKNSKILNRLMSKNFEIFFQVYNKLDLNKIPFSLVLKIRNTLANLQVRTIAEDSKLKDKLSSQFLQLVIQPLVSKRIEEARKIEEVIDLLISLMHFELPEIRESLKLQSERLFSINSPLSMLLKDPEIPNVLRNLNELRKNEEILEKDRDHLEKLISVAIVEKQNLLDRLEIADNKIIELTNIIRNSSMENKKDGAISEVKRFLPAIDQLMLKYGPEVMTFFAQLGLQSIGETGKVMKWNPDNCESLNGELISEGKVVKVGFLVNQDNQPVVLRRVLLGEQ